MLTRTRVTTLAVGALFAVLTVVAPRAQTLKTPAEESNYTKYTQHDEVARFLQQVAQVSKETKVQAIGHTGEAKDFPGANLYLCIITEEGADGPKALNRRKPTFMLTASQHGNEQSGKEAALQLIRDLAVGDMKPLLKQINFLIIPQANPYGNFVNRRQNEQNLDLNRDHVKLEAAETRAIHAVFGKWMPEVTLDVHEKGDDYYRVSTGCVSNVNINPAIERFERETLLKAVDERVTSGGYTWFEYLVTEPMGSQSAAGVVERREPGQARQPREMITRYSTTDLNDGRNSLGIFDTVSFIQEGASRHDIPTLKDRTAWQYLGIRGLMEAAAKNSQQVLKLVADSRAALLKRAKTPAPDNVVHLKMEYVRDPKQPELVLKRFDRPERPEGAPAPQTPPPESEKVVTETVKNWFPKVESRLAVPRPLGYVVPAAHTDVVHTLLDLGVTVERFTKDTPLEVEVYEVGEVVPSKDDYVAPERIEVAKKTVQVTAKAGDFYVTGAQPAANLVPSMLEPQSEYGFIRYRAFKLIPEKGGTFAFLRVVKSVALPLAPYQKTSE